MFGNAASLSSTFDVVMQALTQALGKLRSKMTHQEKENGGKGEDILVSSVVNSSPVQNLPVLFSQNESTVSNKFCVEPT